MSNIDCFEELTFAAVTAAFILLSESLANTLPSQGSRSSLSYFFPNEKPSGDEERNKKPSAKPDKGRNDIDERRAVIGDLPHGGGREAKR